MAEADDYIEQSREAVQTLLAARDELDEETRDVTESEAPGALDRIDPITDWVEHVLASADPDLISRAGFQALHGQLNNVVQSISQLVANPSAYAPNLDKALDEVTLVAAPLAIATPPLRDLGSKASKLGKNVGSRLETLQAQADGLEERLTDLGSEAEQRDTDRLAAQEAQMNALRDQLAQVEASIANETERVTSALATWQADFETAEGERQTAHDAALASHSQAYDTAREELTERVEEFRTSLDARETAVQAELAEGSAQHIAKLDENVEGSLARITEIRDKVEGLYEVIFKAGTASAFNKEAEDEKGSADNWRRIALVFGVFAILVAMFTAFKTDNDDLSVEKLIARLSVALAFGGVAAYAGRQSSRHRKREEEAKQLELDLTAIGPFVEEIDEERRDAVRQLFVERWMASRTPADDPEKAGDDAISLPVALIVKALSQK